MITKPILFSAPMIKAILAGKKSMTRRVARLTAAGHVKEPGGHRRWHPADPEAVLAAPHPVGSIAWVREACWIWGKWIRNGLTLTGRQKWRFLARPDHTVRYDKPEATAKRDGSEGWVYRHARFMPKWASRISLEVTAVKVERVQDISEEDARAEGLSPLEYVMGDGTVEPSMGIPAASQFMHLWDLLNGKRDGCGWNLNPYVFAYTFKRVEVTA